MQSNLSCKSDRLHVGIIMDGNGRWATRRGLPRLAGHEAGVEAIQRAKPTGAKGTYLKKAAVSSSMGPGVKVDVASLSAPAAAQ